MRGLWQHRSIRCAHCRHRSWGVDARPHFTRVEVDCKEQHSPPGAAISSPSSGGWRRAAAWQCRAAPRHACACKGTMRWMRFIKWAGPQSRPQLSRCSSGRRGMLQQPLTRCVMHGNPIAHPGAPQHVEEAQHGAPPLLLVSRLQHPPAAGALQPHAAARGRHPAARLQGLGDQGSRAPQDRE